MFRHLVLPFAREVVMETENKLHQHQNEAKFSAGQSSCGRPKKKHGGSGGFVAVSLAVIEVFLRLLSLKNEG